MGVDKPSMPGEELTLKCPVSHGDIFTGYGRTYHAMDDVAIGRVSPMLVHSLQVIESPNCARESRLAIE